uniref:Uncharacterized protein n=1 Tax=Anopheles dirus TaxID=7168 RepID=A0A182NHV0_9DIPT
MSSARCLNWSRPPPGRHPAVLRKQLSCSEPSPTPPPGGGRSQSVTSATGPGDTDFCHFLVTGAIIHANRLQTYHTYNQAHRGASASLLRTRPSLDVADGGQQQQQQQRRRPASASGLSTVDPDRPTIRAGRRAILCKQLSLNRSILVASTIASGMATVASGGPLPLTVGSERDELGDGWGFSRKQQQQQQQRTGAGTRNDSEAAVKKGLKPSKDSRINIKIFLGQTVQQDSSDTGISDTEGTTPTPTATTLQQGSAGTNRPIEPSVTNMSTDTSCSAAGKGKPTNGNVGNATSNANQSTNASVSTSATGNTGYNGSSGRTSSLAQQRRAQFQANRQNSEAHDRRHPPLVRALSAPIRPADSEASKFLQGKKKPRRRKVLRERDEYNICEEDEYSDDGGSRMAVPGAPGSQPTGAAAGRPMPAACILPLRSRSVLGGPCDIETLVSLLSSGGSDSEKEQDTTQASPGQQSPTATGVASSAATFRAQFSSAHLAKGRAPMLKKTGKSVSFQESDLKPAATAGLNRDYRKPTFQPTVAGRIRRTQQLVSTLSAFQHKDRDRSEEKEKNESGDGGDSDHHHEDSSSPTDTPAISSTNAGGSKAESKTPTAAVTASTTGDLQTPKEQECYRLFLKMSKKGLAVSYDTILRGMLTPTELRVLQKKKSRQRTENGAENGTDGNGTGGESSPETGGISFSEELQFRHGNGDAQLTIPEEPLAMAAGSGQDSMEEEKRESLFSTNSSGFRPLNFELVADPVLPPLILPPPTLPELLLPLLTAFASACTNGALMAATSTELLRLPSRQLIHSESVIFRSLFTSQ